MNQHLNLRNYCLGIILIMSFFLFNCAKAQIIGGTVDKTRLINGVYEGSYRKGPNKAVAKVFIKEQKIDKIEILKHSNWKGKKAESIIPQRIIEQQSTSVESVTGATNSSRVIMNAVQVALEKAYQKP